MKTYTPLVCIFLLSLAWLQTSAWAMSIAPMSSIKEKESFNDDVDTRRYPLSYRISIRPCFSFPVVVKLYITFHHPAQLGTESTAEGLLVVKGIKDGTTDTLQTWKKPLNNEEVRKLVDTIRRQEVFNLGQEIFDAPEGSPFRDNPEMDSTSWIFERVWKENWWIPQVSHEYHYTKISRMDTEYGPVSVVFHAFSKIALKMMKAPPDVSEKLPAKPKS